MQLVLFILLFLLLILIAINIYLNCHNNTISGGMVSCSDLYNSNASVHDMKKILILGAGPVGLITAHRILSLHKNIGVTLIDIRPEYDRQQVLVIQPQIYNQIKDFIDVRTQYGNENSIFGSTFPPRINFNTCIEIGGIISYIKNNLRDALTIISTIDDIKNIAESKFRIPNSVYDDILKIISIDNYDEFINKFTSHTNKNANISFYNLLIKYASTYTDKDTYTESIITAAFDILKRLSIFCNTGCYFEEYDTNKFIARFHKNIPAHNDSADILSYLQKESIITVTISDLEYALFASLQVGVVYGDRCKIKKPKYDLDNNCSSYQIEFGENKKYINIVCVTNVDGKKYDKHQEVIYLDEYSLIFSTSGGRDIFSIEGQNKINKLVKNKSEENNNFETIPYTILEKEVAPPAYTRGAIILLTEKEESNDAFVDFEDFKLINGGKINGKQIKQDRYRIFAQPSIISQDSVRKKSIYMGIQFKDNEWRTDEDEDKDENDDKKRQYFINCCILGCNLFKIDVNKFNIDNIKIVDFPIHIFKLETFKYLFESDSNKGEEVLKIPVCLLGDSAIGVNFFSGTGVNFGIQSALTCTEIESIDILTSKNPLEDIEAYNPLKDVDSKWLNSSYTVSLKYDIITPNFNNEDLIDFIKKDIENKFNDNIKDELKTTILFPRGMLLPIYYFLKSIS